MLETGEDSWSSIDILYNILLFAIDGPGGAILWLEFSQAMLLSAFSVFLGRHSDMVHTRKLGLHTTLVSQAWNSTLVSMEFATA